MSDNRDSLSKVVVNWFPGHMTRANRKIKDSLKLVDCVVEMVDARIPISSRNPDLNQLLQNKKKLLVLTKCDMADPSQTKKWVEYYKNKKIPCIQVDARNGKGIKNFVPAIKKLMSDKIQKLQQKGMLNPTVRVIVVGIPNAGKSSFVNKLLKSNRAKVEDRPGVTQKNQWFALSKNIELLDTPGILWPKLDGVYDFTGENLAFTGAIRDQISDINQLAIRFIESIIKKYPQNLQDRYKLTQENISGNTDAYSILETIATKRGMLSAGGKIDIQRASEMLFNEFRNGKLGNITLESVDMIVSE